MKRHPCSASNKTKGRNIERGMVYIAAAALVFFSTGVVWHGQRKQREREPAAKAAIQKLLQEENRRDVCLGLHVICKSDDLASAQGYIRTNRIILGALRTPGWSGPYPTVWAI